MCCEPLLDPFWRLLDQCQLIFDVCWHLLVLNFVGVLCRLLVLDSLCLLPLVCVGVCLSLLEFVSIC